jgi:hypothetical protein
MGEFSSTADDRPEIDLASVEPFYTDEEQKKRATAYLRRREELRLKKESDPKGGQSPTGISSGLGALLLVPESDEELGHKYQGGAFRET